MMSKSNVLPSRASATAEETYTKPTSENKREDWRKAKELEEARKAGTAPALVDEEGRDINPHIPQYISTVPWYVGLDHPTLKHQRVQEEKKKVYNGIDQWYKKGVKEGAVATKFRKGACTNCGAITHKKKDCLERPRRVGARFTSNNIAPDEYEQPKLSFDYASKRDRWNGYDEQDYDDVLEEFAKIEEAKKELKAAQLEGEMMSGKPMREKEKGDSDNSEDEDKYADDFDMPGTNFDSKRRITVRNLRIREDTAKYLYNLNPNSAYYDPKTRSMRGNPFQDQGKHPSDLKFAGENFVRSSGDTGKMAHAQLFAWEATDKGTDIHLQADPTKLELLNREFEVKAEDFKKGQKNSILDKYGGQEHLEAPPRELLMAQTEDYVEYSRQGTVIKGQEKAVAKSKYEEDVYINNHTTVWGSFWFEGKWGYGCCHSFVKMSYCTGEAGKAAVAGGGALSMMGQDRLERIEEEKPKSLVEQHKEKILNEKIEKKRKKKKRKHSKQAKDSEDESSEDEEEIRRKKLKKALIAEVQRQKEADRILAMDERKRSYNSMKSMDQYKEPTEEEMEAWRLLKQREADPMAQFL
ncbi:pre-mRNA-splicing factor SLU7-like [Anneissia japonica]|uniref:pre-mRNA-splicing factor SLU7-like n=1 Tax=Anneissia japonica TaxID=1529436 RepID=UPI0014259745|nr:pre-mRNA-splicing factor SLU7-like [Anneissia japonica]XP_033122451.1 pre-mRNA-splicing factor SLU7-like [Anneissia japonica]